MDGVDGWYFLNAVRNSPQALAGPIIVTTGSILTREWAEQNGCQGFLRKPIEEDALLDEIERCLGRR
jgi:CheY-like chemotaxis protein